MTPEEKSKELIAKFWQFNHIGHQHAKKIALICCDEIIANHYKHFDDAFPNVIEYWQQVKDSITKL
jgi:hypothetical protein